MGLFDKPRLMEKLKSFHSYVSKNNGEIGTARRVIEVNFSNKCNFKCKHCFTKSPLGDHAAEELPIDLVADISNQADELGIFEYDLQGGELLVMPDKLFEVIKAIKPERFYLYLTTNGWLFDETIAKRLAELGVSKLAVSLDSFDEKIHDDFRGRQGAFKRAIQALKYAKEAGMTTNINVTVAHYNAFSADVEKVFEYSKGQGYTTLLNVACPVGCWRNNSEVMVDDNDRAHFIELGKKYKNISRDIWNPFDRNCEKALGCNTVNRVYVTPIGDVLVCPFLHIKIGNVYEQSLKEIIDYGFSIKHFRNYSDLCLAGEDKDFFNKYMQPQDTSVFNPVSAKDIFIEEDFV